MSSRRLISIVGAAITVAACLAQTHKVTRPEAVVRAVGVYEWTGDLTKPTGSRFVPVTVFINGEIEDAGVYMPRPVPFALLNGNVYELEDAGLSKGTLVLEQAMKTTTPDGAPARAFTEGWTAYGSYKPPVAAEKKTAHLRPSKTLPVIQTAGDSSRPHFSDKSADASKGTGDGQPNGTQPSGTQQPASGDSTKKTDTASDTGAKSPGDDDSRPTMRRRTEPAPAVDDETSPPQDPNAASSQKPSDDDSAERPTLKRRSPDEIAQDQKDQKSKKKAQETASVTSVGSMNDDPDRPTLKHGTRSRDDEGMAKLMGVPADMKQMVAVSDAKNRSAHPFARPWEDTSERAAILVKMQAFARAKLAEYGVVPGVTPPQAIASTASPSAGKAPVGANAPAPTEGSVPPKLKRGKPTDDSTADPPASTSAATKPAATPGATANANATDPAPPKLQRGVPAATATTTASAKAAPSTTTAKRSTTTAASRSKTHRAGATAPPIELAGEDLRGYLLSYGGAPTYVYMAHTVEPNAVLRYVTIVAQDDGMGQLKVALASATDAAHLDRTPWMRLVDAVDVEASNRASLLFELRGQSSRQFALYRVIAAKPEQIFATSM